MQDFPFMNTGFLTPQRFPSIQESARSARWNASATAPPGRLSAGGGHHRGVRKRGSRLIPQGIFFSSVAEVSDLINMKEMLSTRKGHEELTTQVGKFLQQEGYEIFILSTESCDLCETCAYLEGSPAGIPKGCIPVLKATGFLPAKSWRRNRWNIILAAIPFSGFLWYCFADRHSTNPSGIH